MPFDNIWQLLASLECAGMHPLFQSKIVLVWGLGIQQ